MAENLKILVVGDVEGQYDVLFNRVRTINKKSGPFDMLLCVGDFFSSDPAAEAQLESYKLAEKQVPIPTLILGPSKQEHCRYLQDLKGCEVCTNLTYLGDYGVFTGSSGLRMVYVSGKQQLLTKPNEIGFTMEAIKSIEVQVGNSSTGVDILLTSQWPKGVENLAAPLDCGNSEKFGSSLISRLTQKIKPRYHFVGSEGVYYERFPYRNHEVLQEKTHHVTRFIALGKVGNANKLKWIYAFNIAPMAKMSALKLNEQPANTTSCPYLNTLEEEETEARKEALGNQYFYDVSADVMSGNTRGNKRRQNNQGRPPRPPPKPMGPCWFCLSSPEVEKHLVISVGEHCYVAMPKGPLVPEHVLILPIGHYQSIIELPEEVLEEVEKFKVAIQKALKAKGKSVVFFERSFKSPHLQIQCIAVPSEKEDLVKEVFVEMAAMQSINLDELPPHAELRQVVPAGKPYFFLELPKKERFVCHIQGRFPLQFGREVLSNKDLLNCVDRVDWKNCPSSRDQEVKETARFRQLFQPFDFTL
ncbi:CWF19 protein 1 [Daphnia magna]|uniref:CWF19 protein 1 n=1 Tax=Daphnia magna TaxID=35525 RepID=A0A0P5PRB3_9CRUS|nr:CWF19 protein 1 [Daphnia magna]